MRIDWRKTPEPGALHGASWLFQVVEIATGQVLDGRKMVFYADDEKAIIRCYDLDERGRCFLRHRETKSPVVDGSATPTEDDVIRVYRFADGTELTSSMKIGAPKAPIEVSWTEYYCPIRIEANPVLIPEEISQAKELIAQALERDEK